MVVGFVLIDIAGKPDEEVYQALKDLANEGPQIQEIHDIFGAYGTLVKVEAKDFNELGVYVVDKIRTIEGIRDTKTLTGVGESWYRDKPIE